MPPLWRKAPLLLFRYPALLIPIAAAVAVLAIGAASQPLFIASAAGATLDREFDQLDPESIGLQTGVYGVPDDGLEVAQERLYEEVGRVGGVGEPTVMYEAPDFEFRGPKADVRLPSIARTGALDNIEVVEEGDGGAGAWIAASTAESLGLGAGDDLTVAYGDERATVPVAGVYRDLADRISTGYYRAPEALPATHPIARYWGRLSFFIAQPTPQGPSVQPPPVLVDEQTMRDLGLKLLTPVTVEWTFPYDVTRPDVGELRRAVGAIRRIEARANDPLHPLGEALSEVDLYQNQRGVHSFLPGVESRVTGAVAALSAPVRALSLAAQGLALAVIAVAAAFGAQRRAVELRLLVVQGVSNTMQGVRAAIESLLPVFIGAVIGWGAAVLLVRAIGPSPDLPPSVIQSALYRALIAGIVPVLVIGLVTAAIARAQAQQGSSRLRGLAARAPWELVVLLLAGVAYLQIAGRTPDGDEAATMDGIVLLFPLLLVAGGAGLVARLLGRLLPRLRGSGAGRGSAAGYLARRRLAAAPSSALLLVTASSLAIGVLVYAATAASTTDASLDTKAAVNVGSDVAVELGRDAGLDVPFPSTRVGRQEADLLGAAAGGRKVDVLAIDPITFPQAATWAESFSSQPLDEMMRRLLESRGDRLAAIAVGSGIPNQATLSTSRYQMPLEIVGRARAFPGMDADRPMIVVPVDRFVEKVEEVGTASSPENLFLEGSQWIRGDAAEIVQALHDVAIEDEAITTIAALRTRPDLLARGWTLGYLQAVGIVAGLLAFIGTLLYLSARQSSREVAYVLARRMGLSPGSHRRSVAMELAGMLGIATVTGAVLALLATRLLLAQLDPLPSLGPAPLLVLPREVLIALAVTMALACVVGAAVVQRAADRARVSEVLRLAA